MVLKDCAGAAMPSTASLTNRLAKATSPYLRQHADNPVHWQPWDQTALNAARELNRPILLSIGYSACHWCHVMAHESFADSGIAEQMNRDFINIKVDREERPDLDKIYQTAHQLLVGQGGGWPLTVFLTPDQLPFFTGTYFPKQNRNGMPGLSEVLSEVIHTWRDKPDAITEQNARMQRVLTQLATSTGSELPDQSALEAARLQLGERFDPAFGGFGDAPKFPQPVAIDRLLRHYARSERLGNSDRGALHMACHSLRRMALGGIFDQIGGGFARYSVDKEWMIPHFEKMLSDNALLMSAATDAYRATGDALFQRIAHETAQWAIHEMQLDHGGFASSLDADTSEGEGAFYLWTPEQIHQQLTHDEAELVVLRLGLDEKANFNGRWHPQVHMTFSELAKRLQTPRERILERWQRAKAQLLAVRNQRERPAQDDKVIIAWNGLMIQALARTGRFLALPGLIDAAERAEAHIFETFYQNDRLPGFLDDQAFMLAALIELQQARWSATRTLRARSLGDGLLGRFEDTQQGGFYFTATDHEALIQRPRDFTDDALPSGNGVAALALNQLGHWLAEPSYLEAAERSVKAASDGIEDSAAAHCAVLNGLEAVLEPPELVVIRAHPKSDARDWRDVAEAGFNPQRLIFVVSDSNEPVANAPASMHETGAWICRGQTCQPKSATPTELADQLKAGF